MKIEQEQNGNRGSFFIEEDGKRKALLEYNLSGNIMAITHTEVDPALQNRNIGHQLVEAAVVYSRQHHIKIKPECSFAETVFAKEFKDVLA